MRLYHYVGPREIAEGLAEQPAAARIQSVSDIAAWIAATGQKPDSDGMVVATFVVDELGELRVADRHSEHVACASGGLVRSAGEIAFYFEAYQWRVAAVTNQSTGYCPEPSSWRSVASALEGARLDYRGPDTFTPAFEFRRCPSCSAINLVRDGIFECNLCDAELPTSWNFADDRGA